MANKNPAYQWVKKTFQEAVRRENVPPDFLEELSYEEFCRQYRYTGRDIKSRTPATVWLCEKLRAECGKDLPGGGADEFYSAVSSYCSGIQATGEAVLAEGEAEKAFAVWVADVLADAGKIDELNDVLPDEMSYGGKIFFDAKHSNEVLERLAYVCENAESDRAAASAFSAIVRLIPGEIIEEAIKDYDCLVGEIFKVFLAEYNELSQISDRLCDGLDTLPDPNRLGLLSPEALEAEAQRVREMRDRIDEVEGQIALLFLVFRSYYIGEDGADGLEYAEKLIRKIDAVMENAFDNPYKICGIYYILKHRNDHRYWAMGPCITALSYAVKRLPWAGEFEYFDPSHNGEYTLPPMYSLVCPARVFEDAQNPKAKLNFGQIIYHLSGGGLLPRKLKEFRGQTMVFHKSGIPESSLTVVELVSSMLEQLLNRSEYYSAYFDEEETDAKEPEAAEELAESEPESAEALQRTIRELKEKNQRLAQELHRAEEQRRKTQKDFYALQESYSLEHRELADLRNYVFRQENENADEGEEEELKIEFPYEAKHNVVVFGGHESFNREIKPLFKNVRFVYKDAAPNADMIKNAEIVWIQPNALGHANYYKIIDVVRKNKIPVRYFSNASAKKCAEQIVLEDMK